MAISKASQNMAINCDPLSDIMVLEIPCKQTILVRYILAYLKTEYLVLTGIKWADFVSWSTITQIESYPLNVLAKLIMKSIQMSFHFHTGIDSGWKAPPSLRCLAFILQQVSPSATNRALSCFKPFHQNLFSHPDTSCSFRDEKGTVTHVLHSKFASTSLDLALCRSRKWCWAHGRD